MYVARFADGLGFVPGWIPAAPAAAAGISASLADTRRRVIAGVAIGALPAIWLLQWRGQLVPQWGGRYVLVTGALLTVVAGAAIERAGGVRNRGAAAVLAASLAVTMFGVAWHADRTSGVASAAAALESAPRDVVIVSSIAHLGREAGYFYGRHRWLSTRSVSQLPGAVAVARRAGARRIDVVALGTGDDPAPPAYSGYRYVSRRVVDFLGFPLQVRRYARVG
jgi:hypothetical protein